MAQIYFARRRAKWLTFQLRLTAVWRSVFRTLADARPGATVSELEELSQAEEVRRLWGRDCAKIAASVKHTDWKHEDEWRILAPKYGEKRIIEKVLKRVYFVRTDDPLWGEIMMTLAHEYPGVELVHWKFHHGALPSRGAPMEFRLLPAE